MKRASCLISKKRVDIDSYAGNWVAFVDDNPVDSAASLNLLMQKVKKRRLPKEPSIMLIPRKDEGPYLLIMV